jgi:hypothetical protein
VPTVRSDEPAIFPEADVQKKVGFPASAAFLDFLDFLAPREPVTG